MASQGTAIDLQWCPAHVGIEGNKLADKLARNGSKIPAMKKDEFTTHSFIKLKAKKLILEAWNNNWNLELWHEDKGRKAKGLGKYCWIQA